jgi:hypothetical protein
MATVRNLTAVLSTQLDLPRARVERVAHHLQRRGILPGIGKDARPVTSDDAAALLIAVMACGDFATMAPLVVDMYGRLPGRGLTGNLRAALASMIEAASKETPGTSRDHVPQLITISRDTADPYAIIELAPMPVGVEAARRLVFSRCDADICKQAADTAPLSALTVSATITGDVIRALGRLLTTPDPRRGGQAARTTIEPRVPVAAHSILRPAA